MYFNPTLEGLFAIEILFFEAMKLALTFPFLFALEIEGRGDFYLTIMIESIVHVLSLIVIALHCIPLLLHSSLHFFDADLG